MVDLIERQRAARDDLLDTLRKEVLGPSGGENEEIDQPPTTRYLIGRLAPAGTSVAPEEDDGVDEGDDDEGAPGIISMSMNPSSIGLSFVVGPSVDRLDVVVSWGEYQRLEVEEPAGGDEEPAPGGVASETSPGAAGSDPSGAATGHQQPATRFRRVPRQSTIRLDLGSGTADAVPVSDDGVSVEFLVKTSSDGSRSISAFIVNRRIGSSGDRLPPDDLWLFQPVLEVRSPSGGSVFTSRESDDLVDTDDRELLSNELLYWDRPELAVGHGCAADWESGDDPRTATVVRTELVPAWELARVDPLDGLETDLGMGVLGGDTSAGVSGDSLHEMLTPLAGGFEQWINEVLRGELLPRVPEPLRETAEEHIERCEIALERMREGIDLLRNGPDEVRMAFCFANRAMGLQRQRTQIAMANRRGEAGYQPPPPKWRPFQLAFILINIAPMADRNHGNRGIADLLWFPTGGGKTEAYLGLTAFALAHRRLRDPLAGYRNDLGVTVLMRYTLRLLTIQQFQRATALICACEHLRRSEGRGVWGTERFSIGLWVGSSATPSNFQEAKEVLTKIKAGHKPKADSGTPVQLLTCPWCGSDLDPAGDSYTVDTDTEEVVVRCMANDCEFGFLAGDGSGIPVHTVDQQLYRRVPSLVIATVDKFAQMPFKGSVQALFGRVDRECSRHGMISAGEGAHPKKHNQTVANPVARAVTSDPLEPPDLIIQDELHLISGPLGTLVGLYETAVDRLCSVEIEDRVVGPKVIASTATIRRARQQVEALFDRRLQIFPPSGLRSADSWFGREVSTADSPGRLYVGIHAPGKSVKTALVRVYATLLSRAKFHFEAEPDVGDPYMTLVGYFNSLRELGGAIRLIEDDVEGRLKVLHRRDPVAWPNRRLYEREELTSNKKAHEVPAILGKLERRFVPNPTPGQYPVDTLLASNMISVGVDIDRLGLMVVTGQPKTTAEYIQATSRVGRQSPGIVVTVYNWTRPRDVSHLERFRSYHSALYRHVEATSVTPFSSRSRDKGLAGILAGLLRLGEDSIAPPAAAGDLNRDSEWASEVRRTIQERAVAVAGVDGPDVGAITAEEIEALLDRWEKVSAAADPLRWKRLKNANNEQPNERHLIDSQEDQDRKGVFVAPNSLREVESETHVWLIAGDGVGGGSDRG